MAGNTAVLKHASNVPGCALAIQEIMLEAGLPEGVFQTLMVPSAEVKNLIAHPAIAAVTLTGSTDAGRAVARQAGAYLKNSTGTGRQRCIRDPTRCRPRAGCGNLREQSPHQQRPELYCCQAIHRGARRTSRIHRTLCGPHAGKEMGRPNG